MNTSLNLREEHIQEFAGLIAAAMPPRRIEFTHGASGDTNPTDTFQGSHAMTDANEKVVPIPVADFDSLYSKVLLLEAIADVCMEEPEGLASGTLSALRSSLYFGIGEVKELLTKPVMREAQA